MQRYHRRGVSLAGVFLAALVMAILSVVLLGVNSSTLSVIRHSQSVSFALGAAQSASARAIYELKQDPNFGRAGEIIRFQPKSDLQDSGIVCFDPDEAKRLGIRTSVNNLDNPNSIPGEGGDLIPARTARLYSVGRCGEKKRVLVMDLHVPPYPFAIATEGTFESKGDLTLTGISAETGGEIPSDLVTNSTAPDSLVLGPRTEISGDLISAGSIELSSQATKVSGEVRPHSKKHTLPRIDLASFDPRLMPGDNTYTTLEEGNYVDPFMEGKVVSPRDLTLGGDVTMDGSLIFVDGNLSIDGHISGRGAIVCTGSLTIRGSQDLTTDNELAILTGGNLDILGNGPNTSKLIGLLYSEGDVSIRNSTVQGTLISQSNGTTSPSVLLERTNMVHDPRAATFTTTLTTTEYTASRFLGFKKDGKFDSKAAAESGVKAAGMGGKKNDRLFLGATLTTNGTYLIFAPGLSAPVELATRAEAVAKLAEFVVLYHPKYKKKRIKWANDPKKAKSFWKSSTPWCLKRV